jgi:excisionase family DNA binding protein
MSAKADAVLMVNGGSAPALAEQRTLREAARILRCGESTLRAAARRREIGHTRLGRKLLFSDADLREFLSRRRVEAEPAP